jgi:hypothetical protein
MNDIIKYEISPFLDPINFMKLRLLNDEYNNFVLNNFYNKMIQFEQANKIYHINSKFAKKYPYAVPTNYISRFEYYFELHKNFRENMWNQKNIVFSPKFILEYHNEFTNWSNLGITFKFGMPIEFIELYMKKRQLNWKNIFNKLYPINYNSIKNKLPEIKEEKSINHLISNVEIPEEEIEKLITDIIDSNGKIKKKFYGIKTQKWYLLWKHQKLSENFIEKYSNYIYDWSLIWQCQKVSSNFIIKHIDKIKKWKTIFKYQVLSIDFIQKYFHKINNNWNFLLRYQKLPEYFIRENLANISDMKYIWFHQNVSEKFIEEQNMIQPFDKEIWRYISIYQNLSVSFMEKYANKISWFHILIHQTLSFDFITKHIDKIDNFDLLWENQLLSITQFEKIYAIKYDISGEFIPC